MSELLKEQLIIFSTNAPVLWKFWVKLNEIILNIEL